MAMLGFGVSFFLQPALWVTEFEDDGTAASGDPSPQTLRKIRLVGIGFVVVGLLVLYAIFFAHPAVDPVLI